MSIELKENEWAAKQIASHELGKKPTETLRRVARYYIDQGYSAKETRNKLDIFLLQCDRSASIPKWDMALSRAVSWALKHEAVDIDSIDVTAPEMGKIDALVGTQIKRLAFTLLCLAKYGLAISPDRDGWVNNKDSEIMAMANIKTSIKRQSLMYWNLREAGMVKFSQMVDNTSVKVCFMEGGDVVMHITDLRNLGYQYLMYHGEPYFSCSNCGLVVKYSNPQKTGGQKYCPDCAAKIRLQQTVNSVMRKQYRGSKNGDAGSRVYTVYMHQCPNGKRYVGLTSTTLPSRWKKGNGYIENKTFYADIQKYGWENIKHYRIAATQDETLAKDIVSAYVQKYGTDTCEGGYNRASDKRTRQYKEEVAEIYVPMEVDGMGYNLT